MASKREIYRFLSCEAGVYLSTYETMTIWHLRDLACNKRTKILCKDIRLQNVPNFEGLAIKDMLEFAKLHPVALEALPLEKRELEKLPRWYIANIIRTQVGLAFKNWVDQRVTERNQKVTQEKDMIEMDAEIADIYNKSTSISG